jgi:hypothetical protein
MGYFVGADFKIYRAVFPDVGKKAVQVGTAAVVGYILFRALRAAATWECGGCGAWLF